MPETEDPTECRQLNQHPPGLMVGAVEQWSCPHPKFVAYGILVGSHTKPTTTSSSCGWSWFGLLGPLWCLRWVHNLTKKRAVSTPGLATVEPMCVQNQTCSSRNFGISGYLCSLRRDLKVNFSPSCGSATALRTYNRCSCRLRNADIFRPQTHPLS